MATWSDGGRQPLHHVAGQRRGILRGHGADQGERERERERSGRVEGHRVPRRLPSDREGLTRCPMSGRVVPQSCSDF